MTAELLLIVATAVLVVAAGAFTTTDAAFSALSRSQAEDLADEGRAGAKRLVAVLDDLPRHLNTVLLLRMATEVGGIVTATIAAVRVGAGPIGLIATALLMAVLSYVVVAVAPRTFGRQSSERVGLLAAGPVSLLTSLLGPLASLLIKLGNVLAPGKGIEEGPFSSEAQLRELVDAAEASQLIESGERQMIHSVFELGDTLVREVMVPRPDVVFIERHKTLRQAMSLGLRSGFSRIPVIGDNLDSVVGVAYLKDVTKRVFDNRDAESTEKVDSVMRPVTWVPDSKPVDALLREMQAERTHLAVVVDEYGGTAGLVTIEDILEEIVGEITDEYDAAQPVLEHLDDGRHRVTSRLPVDDLLDAVGVEVEEEDVETVGGLMAKHLGKVPIAGSVVEAHGLRFEVESTGGRRNQVATVLITVLPDPEVAGAVDGTARVHRAGGDAVPVEESESRGVLR
ncbi:hemolysin family protein [Nocardioidaceae bacterium]|nr:hemolysin family protein [Nocardioidaceae bacterium]